MVEIISGEKGKGKTKYLLDKVNNDIKNVDGSVVYIDKNTRHMYELDSKIRLINMGDYPIESSGEFLGFLSGVLSQNSDIQEVFLDSFLTVSNINDNDSLSVALDKLDKICSMFSVKFVLSVSKNEHDLPENAKDKIIVSL